MKIGNAGKSPGANRGVTSPPVFYQNHLLLKVIVWKSRRLLPADRRVCVNAGLGCFFICLLYAALPVCLELPICQYDEDKNLRQDTKIRELHNSILSLLMLLSLLPDSFAIEQSNLYLIHRLYHGTIFTICYRYTPER